MNVKQIFDWFFDGDKNVLTPNVLRFCQRKMGDEYLLVEVSYGLGLFDVDLFGASMLFYNPRTQEVGRIDLSKAFSSENEAMEYIKSITKEMYDNADRNDIKRLYQ